ncbi:putative ribonuclease H-like domain-containing protein [Tanacetum coccineum]
MITASKSSKDNLEQPKDVRPSAPIVEEWESDSDDDFLTKSGNVPVNTAKQSSSRAAVSNSTARYVNTATSRPTMNGAKTCSNVFYKSHSSIKRTIYTMKAPKNSDFKEKVNTAKVNNVTTAGIKVVVSVVQEHKENAVKSSTCWIWRPTGKGNPQYALQDQGIFDSGCSRHMTGNKSYLTDYQDIDGGFVAFAGSPKGGKITGKGKIRTGKLDFEDVYFVKELKFNLFSVSQMCDKKNSVLFTETECLILSPDFKLLDESQVLLKVPGQNNIYSFNLKNVVPSGEQESAESNEDAAVDYEQEKEELKMWLPVVPDEDETVDPEILSVKYPIVDWESQNLGSVDMEDIHIYKIIRADGNTILTKSGNGNPQYTLQDQGIFDSGCSRHMTGNKSFLTDYQEIDGGFVAFGGSPKGGKITGKGKIRTGKLDFEDVYFVKELKFNLFSVSQMCDKKNSVLFTETECLVLSPDFKLLDESQVLLKVPRQNNMYSFDLKNVVPSGGLTCLFAKATIDESNLWHRRLGHINFKTMNKLVRGNLVRGLPSKLFENDHSCVACQKGKQHKASCKTKLVSSISHPLQMLHMDLFGPTFVRSINHKIYCLVVTDDYSRFSWVFFLATKDETSGILKTFITGIENQINHKVKIIRCDNGTEFKNNDMNQFCGMKGIKREFSVARTPQQNGVAERKNRTLIEAARTMLADSLLPTTFWAEAVNTACYVQNRVLVTKPHNKTPYELLLGRPPSISFMRPFGCPVTILNTLDPLGKFDGKADEGFLVGYSINSKAFRVFNTRTRKVEENLHINFLENKPNVAGSGPEWLFDIDSLTKSMNYEPVTTGNQTNGNVGIETNVNAGQAGQEKAFEHEYVLLPLMLYNSPPSLKKEEGASNKEDDQHVQDFRAELDNLLVLWIQNQMLDYGFNFMNTKIYIDNESTICIVKNPVFHSKTKHIEIRHHFIRDSYEKKLIQVIKIHTDHNVADLLTKAFDVSRNLDPKKFLMYPRFLQLFLNNQLKDLPEPFNDTYETPSHTKKVFSNMARQSKSFSRKVTPLFESMLVQNQAPEGESSVTPPEPQPTPSTSQPNVSEPQTETPPTVSHEPQTEANIEQILPSPSIYQRKHKRHKNIGEPKSVERAITTDASLVAAQDSDNIIRTQTTAMPNVDIPQGMDTGGSPRRQETMGGAPAQTRMAHTFELMDIVPPTPHDSPLPGGYTPGSDEGRLKLEELMAMCTKLSKQVLDLEKEKDAQAVEILKLKKRVKKLERQRKSSISHPRRRIYRQVESSDDDLDEEDASKQGRKSDKTKPMFKDSDFDGLDDDMENVEGETVYAATSGVSTAGALVSTARPTVSTAGPSTSVAGTSTGILEDEMVTMADTLIAIRQTRTRPSYLPRPTSVVITDTKQEQRRLTTPPPP